MHHSLWMTILQHVAMCKAGDAVWKYGKQLVQAVALYILVMQFFSILVASYFSQSRPAIAARPNPLLLT